ncbi:MAG: hypothetical protein LLG42_16005 [Chloroflexi bacterium]|nr:hypothetical protein [Chloroflexota bacterium]
MSDHPQKVTHVRDLLVPAGILLLVSGGGILLDQRLQTGWLSQTMIILAGLLILAGGIIIRNMPGILAGGLLASISAGGFFLLGALEQTWDVRVGGFLFLFGTGWCVVFVICALRLRQQPFWMLLPGSLLVALGACFLFTPLHLLDLILFLGVGFAVPLLIWGISRRLMGLIIPGSLLLGAAIGIYLGWGGFQEGTVLAHTGITLVFFGLGWFLITVISRVVTSQAIWWPLIPGGTFTMVGWGLYIGGNPSNAVSFISNTGSITLIMLGIYLLLLRKGIH